MSWFRRKKQITVTYCDGRKTRTKRVSVKPTNKRNIYRIELTWNEWIEVEVKL